MSHSMTMTRFSELKAVQALYRMREHPFDLTQENALSEKRVRHYVIDAVGFKLLYATERVTDEVVQALIALAEERKAVDMMQRMQAGDILNYIEGYPSENRAVLHTATRDIFDFSAKTKPAQEAAQLAKNEVEKLEKLLKECNDQDRFHDLVIIGIGGSELGPKALYLSLQAFEKPDRHVHFIGNVDPDDLVKTLRALNLEKTLVAVVSKSGTTLETTVNEAFARSWFKEQGYDASRHFIAITGERSPMDDPKRYLQVFYIWDWIGGRYSGSSIIGGVILSFAFGLEVYLDFLKGAHAMDQNALEKDPKKNLALFGALLGIWNHNFLNIQTCAIIPYSQALGRFTAHLQQLDMESNGKQVDRQGVFVNYMTGPIIWGESGTNAQHSFYQLIHQGTIPIALEFIGFAQSQTEKDFVYEETTSQQKLLANLFAQAIALATGQTNSNPNKVFLGNRPSHILLGKKLTPFALGALLAYFEHKVAFQGFIWNINSFDQEGVQLGKILAHQIIESMKGKERTYPVADAYLEILKTL